MARPTRHGITLAEVLVVLAILGVAVGLLLPSTRRVRDAAGRTQCLNNLKQVITGLHAYEATTWPAAYPSTDLGDGPDAHRLPPGCSGPGASPEERLSWMVALLPHLEQDAVYKRFDLAQGYAGNLAAARTPVKPYLCPGVSTGPGDAVTTYVATAGIGRDAADRPAGAAGIGFMGYDRVTSLGSITDGASNTIALAETRSGLGPWARGGPSNLRGFDPADVPPEGDGRPFGGHHRLVQVAMADGAARAVSAAVEPAKLAAAITVAGGEPFDLD